MTRMIILKLLLPTFKCFRGSGFQKNAEHFLFFSLLNNTLTLQVLKHTTSDNGTLVFKYLSSKQGLQASEDRM